MGKEIERKYLISLNEKEIKEKSFKNYEILQGYILNTKEKIVRLRITNDKSFLTIKTENIGITRHEYEYEIPKEEAKELLLLCKEKIEKKRYLIKENNKVWEIDVFKGENIGLIIAEVELNSDKEEVLLPTWVKEEVSKKKEYYNNNLIKYPYKKWIHI